MHPARGTQLLRWAGHQGGMGPEGDDRGIAGSAAVPLDVCTDHLDRTTKTARPMAVVHAKSITTADSS